MFNKRKTSDGALSGAIEAPGLPLPGTGNEAPASPAPQPEGKPTAESRRAPSIAPLQSSDKPAIISEGFSVVGELRSPQGVLHVEGRVNGTLAAQSIHISGTGEVQGEVSCTSLSIKGSFTGSAVCDELVVASSAVINGKIGYRFLTVGAGASIDGELTHIS
ncbi:polymer-forming cytoskeletal protein [Hydrogenophaga sp.]|uniref:bactofilin family protein n=1 Tax=Hydrogenophaga sp. TaxID=1904254 RepID=UPI0035AFE17F